MESNEISIGMGSFEVRKEGYVLTCVGIGSCIATVIYDPVQKIYGMGHIMLPFRQTAITQNPNKFADVCIPNMIKDILYLGGERKNLAAKIAGGAHMFPTMESKTVTVNTRNIDAVKKVLADESIKIVAEDTGGNLGRTVKIDTTTGEVTVIIRSTGESKRI